MAQRGRADPHLEPRLAEIAMFGDREKIEKIGDVRAARRHGRDCAQERTRWQRRPDLLYHRGRTFRDRAVSEYRVISWRRCEASVVLFVRYRLQPIDVAAANGFRHRDMRHAVVDG